MPAPDVHERGFEPRFGAGAQEDKKYVSKSLVVHRNFVRLWTMRGNAGIRTVAAGRLNFFGQPNSIESSFDGAVSQYG